MEKLSIKEYKKSLKQSPSVRTLCFLIQEDKVLLGMKKKGFGKGKWLGVGGKVNKNEGVKEAVKREVKEETQVVPKKLVKVGIISFYFPYVKKPERWNQKVHIFISLSWEGEPRETDEILPKWFEISKLSLDKMWDDAKYWLPQILKGDKITADFLYN